MKSKFAQLENAHQGLSKVEKMTILATATSKFPAAVNCLQRYKTKYSKLKNRSFIKMSNYLMRHIVEAHQQDVTVQDTGYVSAAAAVRRIEQLEHIIATMKQQQQHQQQQEGTSAAAVVCTQGYTTSSEHT